VLLHAALLLHVGVAEVLVEHLVDLVELLYLHLLVAFVQADDGAVELGQFRVGELHVLLATQPVFLVV